VRTLIVDTHVQVISDDRWKYPRRADSANWVTDTPGEMLLSLNLKAGIDKTVLVQGYGAYEYDNSYAADCARAHPDKFDCVVIVAQRRHDAPERLNCWVEERGARGLRLVTTTEPETFLDDPQTFPVWQTAAARYSDLYHDAISSSCAPAHTVLERFPNVPVALDHLGASRLSDGPPYESLQPLFELARFANLYLKFSTETLYAARRGKSNSREFFGRILDHFGANRLMWGSNFPATHDRPLTEQLALAQEDLSFVPCRATALAIRRNRSHSLAGAAMSRTSASPGAHLLNANSRMGHTLSGLCVQQNGGSHGVSRHTGRDGLIPGVQSRSRGGILRVSHWLGAGPWRRCDSSLSRLG